MNSSIDDGGLEFRGTEATLKIDRSGFSFIAKACRAIRIPCSPSELPRRHHHAHGEFLRVHQDAERTERTGGNRGRGRAGGTYRELCLSARRAVFGKGVIAGSFAAREV